MLPQLFSADDGEEDLEEDRGGPDDVLHTPAGPTPALSEQRGLELLETMRRWTVQVVDWT